MSYENPFRVRDIIVNSLLLLYLSGCTFTTFVTCERFSEMELKARIDPPRSDEFTGVCIFAGLIWPVMLPVHYQSQP